MSLRDDVRQQQATSGAEAVKLGININDFRKESRSDNAVYLQLLRQINTSSPTAGIGRTVAVDFAGQVFNGTNNEYTLPYHVLGQNIVGWHIQQSTGTAVPLAKTTNPAPSSGQFFYDGEFTVRVGDAPATLDGLIFAIFAEL